MGKGVIIALLLFMFGFTFYDVNALYNVDCYFLMGQCIAMHEFDDGNGNFVNVCPDQKPRALCNGDQCETGFREDLDYCYDGENPFEENIGRDRPEDWVCCAPRRNYNGGEVVISLAIDNLVNSCVDNVNRIEISVTNQGNVNLNNVRIVDWIYKDIPNEDDNLVNEFIQTYENQIGSGGGRGLFRYGYTFEDLGVYYHIIKIYYNNDVLYSTSEKIGWTRVNSPESEYCCVDQGDVPGEGELCCDGMPTDGAGGSCGCPGGLGFDPDRGCLPDPQQLCYSSNQNEREEQGLSCAFRWFTGSIIDRTLWWGDRFNNEILDCFRSHENNNPENNPIQICCPYIEYEGKEYGEFENIVVY